MNNTGVPAEAGDLLTVEQAGARLGVSYQTIKRLVRDGELRSIRISPRLLRVSAADVARLIAAKYVNQDASQKV